MFFYMYAQSSQFITLGPRGFSLFSRVGQEGSERTCNGWKARREFCSSLLCWRACVRPLQWFSDLGLVLYVWYSSYRKKKKTTTLKLVVMMFSFRCETKYCILLLDYGDSDTDCWWWQHLSTAFLISWWQYHKNMGSVPFQKAPSWQRSLHYYEVLL